jgi:hypothetical protein
MPKFDSLLRPSIRILQKLLILITYKLATTILFVNG